MSAKLSSSLVMRQPLFFSRGPSCSLLIIPRGRKKYAMRSDKFVAKTVSLPLSNSQVLPRYVILTHTATFVFLLFIYAGTMVSIAIKITWTLQFFRNLSKDQLTKSQRFKSSLLYEKRFLKKYNWRRQFICVSRFPLKFPKSNL